MGEPTRARIVVAEDDDGVRELIRTQLRQSGFAVTCAADGRAALEAIEGADPHAIVLDLNMPQIDGFGVLIALGQRLRKPPPVLVLTARHATGDVKRCLTLGAKDYLAKPFTNRDLLIRVARLIRGSTGRSIKPIKRAETQPPNDDTVLI